MAMAIKQTIIINYTNQSMESNILEKMILKNLMMKLKGSKMEEKMK